MHLDVTDLRNFYYRTGLGRAAQRAIRDRMVDLWPPRAGQTVAGFGFAVPLLRPYLTTAERVIGLMPGPQGVMAWPAGMPNVSVLCEEVDWPIADDSVDRLVLLHGLETSENPRALLDECWRVLTAEGRALFIVPNRTGLWSRREATPFGFGRPFSLGQLEAQLKRGSFAPQSHHAALFAPPSERRFWLRTAQMWERTGTRFAPWLAGGVLMVEAKKCVLEPLGPIKREKVRNPLRVLDGIAQPGAQPA
jgi:SAM-dependent methyltransferase